MNRVPRKTAIRRSAVLAAFAIFGLLAMTGCSTNQINPDAIGLYYSAGMFEGKEFEKIVEPGSAEWTVNDEVVQLPKSQRSFIIRKHDKADINGVISVPSKDGTLIDFEASTAFKLNTLVDDIKDFEGGTARKFYEDLCRHYGCALNSDGKSPDGWDDLLRDKFYPQLESAFKDEARKYDGDPIVNNTEGTLTKLQADVGKTFLQYLEQQTGAKFFCGPSFDRDKNKTCGGVEMLIISADYNNPKVRESREAKKIAVDQSAAQAELARALKDPNYMSYLNIEAMKECAKANKATCVFDASPRGTGISVGAK